MAQYSGYTFGSLSRIGLDNCCIDQNTIQNVEACNYMTSNYFANDCTLRVPQQLALSQPGITYKGGYNVGAGGCNIDDNSKLMIGTIQTHPKCRIDLFSRPFATVPYLGRGSVNPVVESQIMQGEQFMNKKSINNLSEKSCYKYQQIPLLPVIQDRMTNSAYIIETDAHANFIRGGIDSRDLTRDVEYMNKNGTFSRM